MGLGESNSPGYRLLEAPLLKNKRDKLLYLADVRMWMRRVPVFAEGGDTKATVENIGES